MPKGGRRNYDLTEQEIRIHLLLRQMRETIQYAYDAAECLDTAVNRYAGNMASHYKREIKKAQPELEKALIAAQVRIFDRTEELRKQIETTINAFVGVETSNDLLSAIGQIVSDAISRDVAGEVARIARENITPAAMRTMIKAELASLAHTGQKPVPVPTPPDTAAMSAEQIRVNTRQVLAIMREQNRNKTDGRT